MITFRLSAHVFAGMSFFGSLGLAAPVHAQTRLIFDTVSESTPSAISCGFCASEKYGVVFDELPSGAGLRVRDFPLEIQSVSVAVARARVQQDDTFLFECVASPSVAPIEANVAIYAGVTVPVSIADLPSDGPWPGEIEVLAFDEVELTPSAEQSPGSAMFNVMFNELSPEEPAVVDHPYRYLRVVVSVPPGEDSASCEFLGLHGPGLVPIRDDDGRVAPRHSFIYSVGGAATNKWLWNESTEITDPVTFASGIRGDWSVRMQVRTLVASEPDAGPTVPDAGPGEPDADLARSDAGAGLVEGCFRDGDCAGGQRCVDAMCVQISCSTDVDCAGGYACRDSECRQLCAETSECRGGESCSSSGVCAPLAASAAGCTCQLHNAAGPGWFAVVGTIVVAFAHSARRLRRRQSSPRQV